MGENPSPSVAAQVKPPPSALYAEALEKQRQQVVLAGEAGAAAGRGGGSGEGEEMEEESESEPLGPQNVALAVLITMNRLRDGYYGRREGGGQRRRRGAAGTLCDFCNEARAVLYCRVDAARLCLACDRHVHFANTVSSRHPRSLLCNACSSAPSSILLRGRVLCSNCDFDVGRGGGGAQHERRPVEAFSGCPAAADLVGLLGLGEVSLKTPGSSARVGHVFLFGVAAIERLSLVIFVRQPLDLAHASLAVNGSEAATSPALAGCHRQ